MSDVLLVWRPDGIRKLQDSEETAKLLGVSAENLAKRVQVPSHLSLRTRYGEGPHGAFSQVQMIGPGAIAWEFGSRTQEAHAPLRKAMRSSR